MLLSYPGIGMAEHGGDHWQRSAIHGEHAGERVSQTVECDWRSDIRVNARGRERPGLLRFFPASSVRACEQRRAPQRSHELRSEVLFRFFGERDVTRLA